MDQTVSINSQMLEEKTILIAIYTKLQVQQINTNRSGQKTEEGASFLDKKNKFRVYL